MESKVSQRKSGLDALKLLCAFLVVCIHAPFGWANGGYLTAVAAVAVPVFFMITGYFYPLLRRKNKTKQQICKIIKLLLFSNIFYLIWYVFIFGVKGNAGTYLQQVISAKSILEFIVFNESPFSIHLWYLGTILYVLLAAEIMERYRFIRKAYFLIPLLMLCDLVLGKYSKVIWGTDLYYLLSRNALFFGLPFFLLGHWLNDMDDKMRIFVKRWKSALYIVCAISIICTFVAKYVLVKNNLDSSREHYLSTIILAVLLFEIALGYEGNNKIINSIAELGRNHSMFIYIMHMFMKDAVALIVPGRLTDVYYTIRPIIVFAGSLIAAILYKWVVNVIKKKRLAPRSHSVDQKYES